MTVGYVVVQQVKNFKFPYLFPSMEFFSIPILINEKLQIVSGKRRRATSVLPRSIGAAVGFVDQRIG